MNDTQWPRYYVFKQDTSDDRHRYCGSIHAADDDLALMNARDVFVRRPACHSLWVVPESEVYPFQAQDLASGVESGSQETHLTYLVFVKLNNEVQYDHIGDLNAPSLEHALELAASSHDLEDAAVVWLVDREAVIHSDDADPESWFGPASSKPYRQSSFYRTNTMMRAIMRRASEQEEQGE